MTSETPIPVSTPALASEQESLPALPIAIRPMRAEDIPWITDSWLRSSRESHYGVPHDEYMDTMRRVIKRLFGRSRIAIACDPEDSDQTFGFVVWEPREGRKPLLHWAYTKHSFRRFGIFRRLMTIVDPEQQGAVATHGSPMLQDLRKGGFDLALRPHLLLGSLCGREEREQ